MGPGTGQLVFSSFVTGLGLFGFTLAIYALILAIMALRKYLSQ